jgi:hypothetical protein
MTKRATIQFLIILVGVAFEAAGKGYGFMHPFLFTDFQASIRIYIYDNCEHLKFIAMALLVWRYPASAADFKTDGLFVALAVLDFGDYLLTGNNVWFGIQLLEGYKAQFPVSMNTVSLVVFFLYANKQWRMNGSQQLY